MFVNWGMQLASCFPFLVLEDSSAVVAGVGLKWRLVMKTQAGNM